MQDASPPVPVRLPISTIITVLATLLVIHLLVLIAPLFLPLLISILVAVSLTPLISWLESKGSPRGLAIALSTVAFGLLMAVLAYTILPSVYREALSLVDRLPEIKEHILKRMGSDHPLYGLVESGLKKESFVPSFDQLRQVLFAGNVLFGSLAEVALIFVMTVYLTVDGPRIFAWVSAFFTPSVQRKIEETNNEVSKIISAYVIGQFITSFLSFLFVLTALSIMNVSNALLLATLAGILDILPVLGFVLAVVPAMIFATSVSANMPWVVLSAYIFYHLLENYFITPFVYGKRMQVSGFVVFFSLIAAGLVAGIEGAIVILPIVASYPIVERIWLQKYVRKAALVEHSRGFAHSANGMAPEV